MLILTRNIKQKIIINDNIEIIVLKTKGKQVKIGIVAPKEVSVNREEVYLNKTHQTYSPDKQTE